ncbi:MAG: histidine--tRNA ligase [Candidatus Omnitrophota bacterium]
MEDILPTDVRLWQWIESVARRELELYGYEEIRTPALEDTGLFARSIGETTDIVTKEMYTFKDRKDRSLTLRPEGTAPIVRAFIEHSLDKISRDSRLYYIGPMFRSERPQKGRSRQFYQIGVERFGGDSYSVDATMILQLHRMLESLGLSRFTIKINTLGCKSDKESFADDLKEYLEEKRSLLCGDCKERIGKNVLRTLDCKNENCIQIVRGAPNIIGSLCDVCKDHYNMMKNALNGMQIPFVETKNLVRGIDYYTGTVFEVTHPALGGQDAIGAGGRYDDLVKDMGGADTKAIGYAVGIERIIIALGVAEHIAKPKVIYVAILGDGARQEGEKIAEEMRTCLGRKFDKRISVMTGGRDASLKSQMRNADKLESSIVLILGEEEIKKRTVIIKDMEKRQQTEVSRGAYITELKNRLGE